jgi:xylose isomerase
MLGFIQTLDHPEMVGVNPEFAHEHMAGLNFLHAISQAWDAGKLFHIDLNDQNYVRFDQDWRFGTQNWKQSFFTVKFLEDVGYTGSRHFDAHAFRSEDYEGVKDFARGCMRSYLIFKDKARQFNEDKEIQGMLADLNVGDESMQQFSGKFTPQKAASLKAYSFDREAIGARGLKYEKLDQLVTDLMMGVR